MIAIFSDLHLGIKGDNQHWHSVAVEFIQDMVKTLKEKNIKDVFFLGDWFHNRNSVDVYTLNWRIFLFIYFQVITICIFPEALKYLLLLFFKDIIISNIMISLPD